MSDELALLAAILAATAEDTPRLVYADWLEENGQEERGEFVRVQCELAHEFVSISAVLTSDADPNETIALAVKEAEKHHGQLRRRERELFDCVYRDKLPGSFVPTLDGHVGRDSPHAHYKRGFVFALTCSWSDWLAHHTAILARQPIEKVVLTTQLRHWSEEGIPGILAPGHMVFESRHVLKERWPGIEFELPPRPRLSDPLSEDELAFIRDDPDGELIVLPDGEAVNP